MVMKIKVCQTHIDEGERFSCRKCPVALAVKSHPTVKRLGCEEHVMVSTSLIDIRWCGDEYQLPAKVKRFINQFDKIKKVKPFSFEIKLRLGIK
jgi:hypothetical protein